MQKLSPEGLARLRNAIRYLLERNQLEPGAQAQLAAYYGITRQRVHQVVVEQRQLLGRERAFPST